MVALLSADIASAQSAAGIDVTCPTNPNWSTFPQMQFSSQEVNGRRVLLAEGQIDDDLIPRLQAALNEFRGNEVWLRSPGGNERIAREAGILLRRQGVQTRIPNGWACHAGCNFMFMGGIARSLDEGGLFIVRRDPPRDLTNVPPAERRALSAALSQAAALMASEDINYPMRMGISRAFAANVLHVPAVNGVTRLCLSQEAMRRYNLVNNLSPPPVAEANKQN